MSDLISRKAVIDYLREQHGILVIEDNNPLSIVHPEALKGMKCANEAFNNFILLLPAAYDVDKVVEQLEKIANGYKHQYDMGCYATEDDVKNAIYGTGGVIDIVKGAVKDE